MNDTEKLQALENAMHTFKFPKKYFFHPMNKGRNIRFGLASKSLSGGLENHSMFMSYDEANCYLKGWYDCKMKKFN